MQSHNKLRKSRLAAAAGTLAVALTALGPLVPAQASMFDQRAEQATLPAGHEANGIHYVTGGIGKDQAHAFRREMSTYPLAIHVMERKPYSLRHEATANAQVRITSRNGQRVFQARADGPYMLVQLPPGHYDVTATLGNRTIEKHNVAVTHGRSTHETFVFPEGAA